MSFFSGRVQKVLFKGDDDPFYVLRMSVVEEGDPARSSETVVGTIPGLTIDQGSWFSFEGKWDTHPKYGSQLKIKRAPILKDGFTADVAENMLIGANVDKFTAKRIRKSVGDDDFVATLSDETRLAKVGGLNKFTAKLISSRWASARALFEGLSFLNDIKIAPYLVKRLWDKYGDRVEEVLTRNPWLMLDVPGIQWSKADEVALHMGVSFDCPERLRGAVMYTSRHGAGMGHVYMTTGEMLGEIRALIPEAEAGDVGQALVECFRDHRIFIDGETRPGVKAIYDPWGHHLESESAEMLQRRTASARVEMGFGIDRYMDGLALTSPDAAQARASDDLHTLAKAAVAGWEKTITYTLSDDQKQGILNALVAPVSVIAGLPGTGKTTSLRALADILTRAHVNVLLVAPTGIAAKRVKSVTGQDAFTIHRAFGAKGGSDNKERAAEYKGITGRSGPIRFGGGGGWSFDTDRPHSADVIVVDEASMVDQHLLYRILACTSPECRVVLVGDAAQLPSVGPGNVLRDLIKSGHLPTVHLTEIFRQADTSQIVFAAHDVHHGIVPDMALSNEFCLIPRDTEDQILATVLKLAQGLHAKGDHFQVLSPKHRGKIGVTNLNEHLRELLNPADPTRQEVRLRTGVFRQGDKVMVVKNHYDLGVFNGDVGKIIHIDFKGKVMSVSIKGGRALVVHFRFNQAADLLRMAYACTVHKMQGLEVDKVVMPIFGSFHHQLQRNLFYTAITRAKKQVVLVGTERAVARAVANDREDFRNTLLPDRLAHLF